MRTGPANYSCLCNYINLAVTELLSFPCGVIGIKESKEARGVWQTESSSWLLNERPISAGIFIYCHVIHQSSFSTQVVFQLPQPARLIPIVRTSHLSLLVDPRRRVKSVEQHSSKLTCLFPFWCVFNLISPFVVFDSSVQTQQQPMHYTCRQTYNQQRTMWKCCCFQPHCLCHGVMRVDQTQPRMQTRLIFLDGFNEMLISHLQIPQINYWTPAFALS